MKKSGLSKFRSKSIKDLEKIVADKRLELIRTKADIISAREKNLKKSKTLRRELSQILTLLREKKIIELESEDKPTEIKKEQKTEKGKKEVKKKKL